jgi:hypothetical protein
VAMCPACLQLDFVADAVLGAVDCVSGGLYAVPGTLFEIHRH